LKPSKNEMPDHRSYFGNISGSEAETILRKSKKRNCYLTRFSDGNDSYTVSVIFLANNEDKIIHLKLSIDNDNSSFSLEGTQKKFHALDDLLKFYERNTLSSEIRNLGSPCVPPNSQRKEFRSITEEAEPSSLEMSGAGMKELTNYMFTTLTQQTKEYRQQMMDYQRYLDEKMEKGQDRLSRLIETQRIEEQRRTEELRRREEQKENDFQKIIEQLGKQKEMERQKIAEEHRKEEENRRIKDLEDRLQEQAERFEQEQKKLEQDRKNEEEKRKAEESARRKEEDRRRAEEAEKIRELEKKLSEKRSCTIS